MSRTRTRCTGGNRTDQDRSGGYKAATWAGRRAIAEGRPFPTNTEIAVLHERVLANHPYAVEAVIERLLPLLTHVVQQSFPRTDEDLIVNAVEDALLEYSRQPQRFDRSRGIPLLAFLRMAALRNAMNLVRTESRRLRKEKDLRAEAGASPAANPPQATADEVHDPAILASAVAGVVRAEEERAVALWLKGERRTEPLAVALGIGELTADQQRRTVKQLKDRMRKRLQRILRR